MTQPTIPVPEVMRQLIEYQNEALYRTQQNLYSQLAKANAELMKIMGLNPEDGWQLDVSEMVYVRNPMPEPEAESPDNN